MSTPLFSVIVPVYKVEKYINKCVDSILCQTYGNFELILVDDGSSDNCPVICDEYAKNDARVKVIHKQNGGVNSARKAGVNDVRGEYVICVDGDDWITPDYLEKAEVIIKNYLPDIICFGSYDSDGEHSKRSNLPYRIGLYNKPDIEKEIFHIILENEYAVSFSPTVWAKVYKRELYKTYQNAVTDLIVMGEDGAVVKPCLYNADSVYIDDSYVYYYRYNPASITKTKQGSDWCGPKLRAEHLMRYIDMNERDFQQQLYRLVVHALFNVVVSQFNREEKYATIKKEIKQRISEDIYAEAIKKARFKSKKGRFMLFALRHRCFLLMKIYNKIK